MNFTPLSTNKAASLTRQKRAKTPLSEQMAMVKQWKLSQLKQTDFCRLHQIHPKTFSRWVRRWGVDKKASLPNMSMPQDHGQLSVESLELVLAGGASFCFKGALRRQWVIDLLQEICQCKFN